MVVSAWHRLLSDGGCGVVVSRLPKLNLRGTFCFQLRLSSALVSVHSVTGRVRLSGVSHVLQGTTQQLFLPRG